MRHVFHLEAIGRVSVIVKNVNFEAANQFWKPNPRGGLQNDVLCSELTLQNQIIKSNTKNAREVNPCFDGEV